MPVHSPSALPSRSTGKASRPDAEMTITSGGSYANGKGGNDIFRINNYVIFIENIQGPRFSLDACAICSSTKLFEHRFPEAA